MRKYFNLPVLLFIIFLVLLLAPPLRDVVRVQVIGSPLRHASVWYAPLMIYGEEEETKLKDEIDWPMLAKKNSGNIYFAVMDIENDLNKALNLYRTQNYYYDSQIDEYDIETYTPDWLNIRKKMAARYTDAIKRFPRHPATPTLIARRLQCDFTWLQPLRGSKVPLKEQKKPSLKDFGESISLCRKARLLEPDNAYFDWALCKMLYMSDRDEEAQILLPNLCKKTRYDDHATALWQNCIKAYESVLNRPLLVEEKRALMMTPILTDQLEWPTYHILQEKRTAALRRGNHVQTLRWAEYLLRIHFFRAWQASKSSRTWTYTNDAAIAELYTEIAHGLPGSPNKPGKKKSNIALFEAYAQRHGRADLANFSKRNVQRCRQLASPAYWRNSKVTAMDAMQYCILEYSWHLQVILLLLITGAIGPWLLVTTFLRGKTAARLLATHSPPPPVSTREVIGGVFACSGLRAVCCAAWAAFIGLAITFFIALAGGEGPEILRIIKGAPAAFTSTNWNSFWSTNAYSETNSYSLYFRLSLLAWPGLIALSYIAWRAVRRQRLLNGEPDEPGVMHFLQVIVTGSLWLRPIDYDFARAFVRIIEYALFLALLVAWIVCLLFTDFYGWWIIVVTLLGIAQAILLSASRMRWWKRPRRRETARYGLLLLRSTLFAFIVTASAAYLALGLTTLPLRLHAEKQNKRILRYGEFTAWEMRDR